MLLEKYSKQKKLPLKLFSMRPLRSISPLRIRVVEIGDIVFGWNHVNSNDFKRSKPCFLAFFIYFFGGFLGFFAYNQRF